MELFNEYYNSNVQFLINLFSLNHPFTAKEAITLARESNVDVYCYDEKNTTKELDKWVGYGLLEKCDEKRYRVSYNSELYPFAAPLNSLESEYLADVISTKEAELFSDWTADSPLHRTDCTVYDYIRRKNSVGKKSEADRVDKEVFRTILSAIYEKRYVEHMYRTNASPKLHSATVIPYRFEYSVFDGRWWLISYNEEQDRTIKSRLENIKSAKLGEEHHTSEETIRAAIMRHIESEPVVLYITNERNTLERCFLLFEDMLDMTAYQLGENKYRLQFRYFDWDQNKIVRQLLYLGENVIVESPAVLIKTLISELRMSVDKKHLTNGPV